HNNRPGFLGERDRTMANSRSGESVVDRIIKVLSAFERAKPRLTVSALARETGLPNSTVHRRATELCDVGFLDRDAQGKVGIGMRFYSLFPAYAGVPSDRGNSPCKPPVNIL